MTPTFMRELDSILYHRVHGTDNDSDTDLLNVPKLVTLILFVIYLQTGCIEKCQFELCSKYDREHDFDVILR